MGDEVRSLITVWLVAVPAALAYCYTLPSIIKPGKLRLLAVLPVIVLFFLLPFSLSSIHLRLTAAGFLCWLATFKLLLFSFDRGPLCEKTPLALPGFIAVAALPIMIKESPPRRAEEGKSQSSLPILVFTVKGFLLALLASLYPSRHLFHRGFVLALFSLHLYLEADLVLGVVAVVGRAMLPEGTVLEPQFAAPYLSSSLQEFWARRWNLMVSRILRSAVYDPLRHVYGRVAGLLAAFVVSALMHEILWIYATLQPPTGEVSSFFVLHGFCTATEIFVKRWWARRGLAAPPRAVTAPVTVAFVLVTSWWLFTPQLTRTTAEKQIIEEAEEFFRMLRRIIPIKR